MIILGGFFLLIAVAILFIVCFGGNFKNDGAFALGFTDVVFIGMGLILIAEGVEKKNPLREIEISDVNKVQIDTIFTRNTATNQIDTTYTINYSKNAE